MKYVMITQRANHWDKLPDMTAGFARGMFKKGMDISKIKEDTKTTFIKLNIETGEIDKAWIGKVSNLRITSNHISFKVNLEKEIAIPKKYADYNIGWYLSTE